MFPQKVKNSTNHLPTSNSDASEHAGLVVFRVLEGTREAEQLLTPQGTTGRYT